MTILSLLLHITLVQFFVLLQHPLVSFIEALILFLHVLLGFTGHNWYFINDMMWYQNPFDALIERLMMHSVNGLDMVLAVAVYGQL